MQNFGEQLREDLKKYLNTICFHLMGDNVRMCEIGGIGSICVNYSDAFEKLKTYLKTLEYINIIEFDEHHYPSNQILFYSNEHKSVVENNTNLEYAWGELGCQIAFDYFIKENGFTPKDDYRYSLNTEKRPYLITYFATRGSEVGGDRRVEAEDHIRPLNELEILEKEKDNKNKAIIQSINVAISKHYENYRIAYNSQLVHNDLQNGTSPEFSDNFNVDGVNLYLRINPSEKSIEWNEFNKALEFELEATIRLSNAKLKEIRPFVVSFE